MDGGVTTHRRWDGSRIFHRVAPNGCLCRTARALQVTIERSVTAAMDAGPTRYGPVRCGSSIRHASLIRTRSHVPTQCRGDPEVRYSVMSM